MIFGNPVPGRIGPPGHPDPASGFVVTSPFGPRGDGFHDGLDIDNGGAPGDPILAMAAGYVYQSFTDAASGGAEIIRIDHGGGWTTGYAHMSVRRVQAGATVTEGQRIGDLGETGWATGPHLHMDTSYQNERRDPWPLLRQNQEEEAPDVDIAGEYLRAEYGTTFVADGTANLHTEPTADSPILQAYPDGTGLPGTLVVSSENAEWYVVMLYVTGRGYCLGYLHEKNVRAQSAPAPEPEPEPPDPCAAVAANADRANLRAFVVLGLALALIAGLAFVVLLAELTPAA